MKTTTGTTETVSPAWTPSLANVPAHNGFRTRKIVRISGSRIGNWNACKAQFAMENFLYHPTKRDYSSFAAEVGNANHAAWQMYLLSKDLDVARATLGMHWPYDHPFPDNKRPMWRSMDLLEDVCALETSNYELLYVRDAAGEEIPAIELPVKLVIHTEFLEVHYTGYIDAVVVDPDGNLVILDLKTTGMRENDFVTKYRYDMQIAGYAIIMSSLVHGGQLGHKCRGAYIGAYTMASGEPWIRELEKTYTKEDTLAFVFDQYQFAAQVHMMQKAGKFPRNPDNCMQYGRPCPHHGTACEAMSLWQMQKNLDPSMSKDMEYEFDAKFTVVYEPDRMI